MSFNIDLKDGQPNGRIQAGVDSKFDQKLASHALKRTP
jgi:hypothetical protein